MASGSSISLLAEEKKKVFSGNNVDTDNASGAAQGENIIFWYLE